MITRRPDHPGAEPRRHRLHHLPESLVRTEVTVVGEIPAEDQRLWSLPGGFDPIQKALELGVTVDHAVQRLAVCHEVGVTDVQQKVLRGLDVWESVVGHGGLLLKVCAVRCVANT
jgi:hypothetical protein